MEIRSSPKQVDLYLDVRESVPSRAITRNDRSLGMRKYVPWIGTTILALVALTFGATSVLSSWPRWVLVSVGVLILVGVVLSFPWPTASGPRSLLGGGPHMTQKAGDNSRQIQGARDVYVEGGMGDGGRTADRREG